MAIEIPLTENYLKAADFNEEKTLKFVSYEYTKANNPNYGDDDGMVHRLTFKDKDKKQYTYDTTSVRFCKAFNDAKVDEGDIVKIHGTGEKFDRQYTVVKPSEEELADTPF